MEKIITSKVRQNLNEKTARFILEQVKLRQSCILEQLRKSTDRNYTMTGFIMTTFMAITAFVTSMPSNRLLLLSSLPLWIGTGIALLILFWKVINIHLFMSLGETATTLVDEHNVDVALGVGLQDKEKANDALRLHLIVNAIEHAHHDTEVNRTYLHERCRYVKIAMTAIMVSIITSAMTAVTLTLVTSW